MTDAAGQYRRLDRYELLAQIASGGMGSVLLARLSGAGGFARLFAIKVMHPHLMENSQLVGMLLEEARLAAKIHHPNVVATVDVGQHDGFYYIVMDYVDGFPLTRILDGGPFNRKERIRIVNRLLLDAMAGLTAAHTLRGADGARLGIVHRDVSPQNILIGADGVGRLTDFGIALAASHAPMPQSDNVKGKPSYLAPEQATGKDVDLRADLWALGVILWEGITGRRLFVADTEPETVEKVLSEPIPSPAAYYPDVPADLEALCLRALDRDPKQRHKSAREMSFELEQIADEAGLLADTHEVSDLLRDRLGIEIEGRRRAIHRYGAPAGTEVLPASLNDVAILPKLAEDASPLPLSPRPNSEPYPVGSETLPASRLLLRTTPAGTASENPPQSTRRFTGVFALLALFGLGSLTTLCLLQLRILNDFYPGLSGGVRRASVFRVSPRMEKAHGVVPEAKAALAPPAVESQVALQPATKPEPSSVAAASADVVVAVPVPVPVPVPVQPKPAVPRVHAKKTRVQTNETASVEPALPVEENPYRLK